MPVVPAPELKMASTEGDYSPKTLAILRDGGWFPGRTVDTAGFERCLLDAGYTAPPVALEFLSEFGELAFEWAEVLGSDRGPVFITSRFHFNPCVAVDQVEPGRVHGDYERLLGCALCPVGEADNGHSVWFVADHGGMFRAYDDMIVRMRGSHAQAIDAHCRRDHSAVERVR